MGALTERRNNRHHLSWSPQGQEGYRTQAVGHWTRLDQWTICFERLSTPAHQPEVFVGHQDQCRRVCRQGPQHINDAYFKRAKKAVKAKKEGDIFEAKKEEYKPSEQRKTDQTAVDAGILEAIKKHADGKMLKQYLRTGFGLSKGEFPHKMVF